MSYSSPRLGCRRVETPIFLPPGDAISAIINGFWADTRTSSRPAPPSKRRFRLCAYSLLFLLPWFFTNPLSAVPCAYTLTPLTATTAYTAGTGSVIVSGSPSGCTGSWTAVSWSALFTSSPTPVSGSGSASVQVNFSYGANPNATSRVGSINFYASGGASFPSGSSYTLTQDAAPGSACTYTLTPLTATTAYTAGTGSVIVSGSPSGCTGSWTAVSWSALFTSSPTPVSGSGSASVQVNFSYGANPNATSRVGSINFYASGASFPSGSSYTLTQNAAPGGACIYTLTPLTATTAYTAWTGSGVVRESRSGCSGSHYAVSWSALFTSSPTPVSGSGSASVQVNFSYGANPNATSRVGSINFYASGGASFPSGSSYTLTQDAAPGSACTYTLTPLTATTAYTAGTGSVIVSGSPSGCIGSWTAVSWSALFTSSPTPVSGSGSASVQVNFSYGANPNATSRVGSINFYASGGASFPSGSSYTLTQDAAPGQSTTFIIPSTAHSPGANGAFYTSNVTVTNLA